MDLLRETPMEVGWLVWSPGAGREVVTVAVKATFDLPEEGEAVLADEQRFVTGDEHLEDDVERSLGWASDLEPLKPRGEWWVVGSFHAAHGLPVAKSVAAAAIGGSAKQVAVTGDRVWRTGRMTEPSEISSLPLGWERAFGGPGFDANPIGRGLAGPELPNVEDPSAQIAAPDQRPRPAGLGPIPRQWHRRARWLGTYDAKWLAERYPGFADDLDYRAFLAAPEDQQIDGYWAGDEAIRLRHLHPRFASVSAQLPGLRAQAFLVKGGQLTDVGLRLDTIAIDADAGQAVLVWRGVTDLPSKKLDAFEHLFVVHQQPGERHQLADYGAWYQRAVGAAAQAEAEEEASAAPEAPPSFGSLLAATPSGGAPSGEGPSGEAPFGEDEPGAKWAHLDQAMTVRGDDSALAASFAAEIARRQAEEKSAAFRPVFDDALRIEKEESMDRKLTPEEALALEMELALGDLDAGEAEDRRRVRDAVRDGVSMADWDLAGVDLSGVSLVNADLSRAILKGANLSGAFVRGCVFDGANLSESELSDAVFEQCSFVGADFSPSRAERVRFNGCRLEQVTASEVYLRSARFTDCSLELAELAHSDLGEAAFEGCKLDGADLSGCTLTEARFTGGSLVDAWLEGVKAERSIFDRCDCSLLRAAEGATFEGASFKRIKLDGARFSRSKLRAADLSLASLERADLSGALLAQAKLMGAVLRAANLDGAVLVQASLLKADLYQARFEGANLKHADLRGANLYQAELWKAELDDARLDLANLTGTRLA
ncbi:MAG: DUF2169 domain-containing protein [Myxococcales bacterium]|nr:DUF2169 domain-containing protein [Myxococcales bacterium]